MWQGQIVLMPVAAFAWATDLAGDDVECRKQGRRAVAHIVMGHSLRVAQAHGQHRLGAVQLLVSASFRLHTAPRPCPADGGTSRRCRGPSRQSTDRWTA